LKRRIEKNANFNKQSKNGSNNCYNSDGDFIDDDGIAGSSSK
jgi:hypothetical protein